MTTPATSFYVTGGTLQPDAASYVERRADHDLFEGLLEGEFCYVLTSRQMGKSSLMVRTAHRLRERGVNAIVLDLTAFGQNLSPEQWYDGLMVGMGRQLRLEDELETFWLQQARLGPCQRLFAAIAEVILPELTRRSRDGARRQADGTPPGPASDSLVIFVDELDTVRSLPFDTDEFFAAIRECYNRRALDPCFKRLTFCLLGVATPSDLIRDVRSSPFNIGRRIELHDFTPLEAAKLADGLNAPSHPSRLLHRVLHWTCGHPYLTQRFCRAIAEANHAGRPLAARVLGPTAVDRLCRDLFIGRQAREQDDNLIFVRDRILRSGVDRVALLELYRTVRVSRRGIADDRTSPLVNVLQLSGIVRSEAGALRERNRIYADVFDESWVRENLPTPEVRRQRAAFWRGVIRTAGIALIVCGAIAVAFWGQWKIARIQEEKRSAADEAAARNRAMVEERERSAVRLTVANGVQWLNQGDWLTALLWFAEAFRLDPNPDNDETHRLRLASLEDKAPRLVQMWLHGERMSYAEFAPGGQRVFTGDATNGFRLWSVASGEPVSPVLGRRYDEATLSPDGRWAVTSSLDAPDRMPLQVWDVTTGVAVKRAFERDGRSFTGGVFQARFSPGGEYLAGVPGDSPASVVLWETATGREVRTFASGSTNRLGHTNVIWCVRFSQDGTRMVTASADMKAIVWEVANEVPALALDGHTNWVYSACFSPDGRLVATSSFDRTWRLWEASTGTELYRGRHEGDAIRTIEFSPDGGRLLTAGWDLTVRLWDVKERRLIPPIFRDNNRVMHATFSPDGHRVLTVNWGGIVRVWKLAAPPSESPLFAGSFSPDGRLVAKVVSRGLEVSERESGRPVASLELPTNALVRCQFSQPGDRLLTVTSVTNQTGEAAVEARLWDLATAHPLHAPLRFPADFTNLVASPDLQRLVAWTSNKTESRFMGLSFGQPEPPSPLILTGGPIRHIAFDRQAERIAVGWSTQAQVFGFSAVQPTPQSGSLPHTMQVFHLAFSPDGEWLATASADQTLNPSDACLWRLAGTNADPVLKHRLSHRDGVLFATFSPDGQRIATCSEDQTAIIWGVGQGTQLTPPLPHANQVFLAAFSANGRWLVTVDRHNTAQVWDATTGEPITLPLRPPATLPPASRAPNLECAFASGSRAVWVTDLLKGYGWIHDLTWDEHSRDSHLGTAQLLSAQRQAPWVDLQSGQRFPPGSGGSAVQTGASLIQAYASGQVQPVSVERLRQLWESALDQAPSRF